MKELRNVSAPVEAVVTAPKRALPLTAVPLVKPESTGMKVPLDLVVTNISIAALLGGTKAKN